MPDTHITECWQILHVEDSRDDAELVGAALAGARPGCEITRVETEAAYQAALDRCTPDAIICDYRLPRFSAERALAVLRERDLQVPFVIVSHHLGETAAVIAMQNGASDYLPKGDLARLGKSIEASIDRARARMERAAALAALQRSEAMTRSVLDSLSAKIAVCDGSGAIMAVNKTWEQTDGHSPYMRDLGPGGNYLVALQSIADEGDASAVRGVQAFMAVRARETGMAATDYQLPGAGGARWFSARFTPLEGSPDGVVVSKIEITDRMMAHVALDKANRRLQALSTRVLTVQEEERRNISRELHDDFGQSLTALKISLHRLARDAADPQRQQLNECLLVADATIEKIRALAQQIRPPQLDQLGLAEALASLAERQRIATGLDIRFAVRGPHGRRVPNALETACYRIAQEAISNASRHGKASTVEVCLEIDGNLLRITVHDDGAGFDQDAARQHAVKSGSLGLIGMEERAQLAGGRLKVRSVRGSGTCVSAIFPLGGGDAPAKEPR